MDGTNNHQTVSEQGLKIPDSDWKGPEKNQVLGQGHGQQTPHRTKNPQAMVGVGAKGMLRAETISYLVLQSITTTAVTFTFPECSLLWWWGLHSTSLSVCHYNGSSISLYLFVKRSFPLAHRPRWPVMHSVSVCSFCIRTVDYLNLAACLPFEPIFSGELIGSATPLYFWHLLTYRHVPLLTPSSQYTMQIWAHTCSFVRVFRIPRLYGFVPWSLLGWP